jgi:1-acyl-sn-glycerol-3-phosphate acyltransferase
MMSFIFLVFWLSFSVFFSLWINNYYLIPLWILLGYFVGIVAVVLTLFLNLPIMKRIPSNHRYKYYVTKSTSIFLNRFIMRLKIDVSGLENVPNEGKLTVYANHKSYGDAFIILSFFPRPTTFTPKMPVYKMFFIGKWLKYMDAFPIDRSSDRNTARAMVDAIKTVKNGLAMVIFPEGGIKDRDEEKMVDMRAGAYRVATKAGADLLPIRIIGSTKIKYRAPFRTTKIKVVILPVVTYESIKDLKTAEIADLMFHKINTIQEEE